MEIQDINVNTEVQGEQAPIDKQEVHEEKMLPQSKVNEIVESRLNRERAKLEKQWQEKFNALEESIKLQSLSESEKAHYQAQKEKEAFEAERKAFYAERDAFNKQLYKAEIQRQLNEANLPDISDTLVGLEAEVVKAQIDTMKQSFDAQINRTVESRIKASASIPTVPQKEQQLLTIEQIKALSVDEYNANRDLVQKSLQAMNK
jgi:hypothetical protein